MKNIFFLPIIFLWLSSVVWGEMIALPPFPKYTISTIETFNQLSREKIWKETYVFNTGIQAGRKFLLINVKGEGKYGGSPNFTRWIVNNYYYADPYIQPYYSKKDIFSDRGVLNEVQTIYYDQGNKMVYFTRDDRKAKKTTLKTLDYKNDILDRYIYAVALQSYPFEQKRDLHFHYLSDDPTIYSFVFSYAGKETLDLPFGSYHAYKLKLKVDLGALEIVNGLLPDNYFWISDTDPPMFIKYSGLESGLGSPMVIMQLTEKPRH
jgi:hypothetical protein